MLVSEPPKQTHEAIESITKDILPNSLHEPPQQTVEQNPQAVEQALRGHFNGATVNQFATLASMDRNRDVLSIAQVLLDTVAATAMPRPHFENIKITAEDKHIIEQSYRDCQRAMQLLTQRLFSYNAKLAQNTPVKNTEILDCLAGLLVGYLNKEPKSVV